MAVKKLKKKEGREKGKAYKFWPNFQSGEVTRRKIQ